MFPAPCRSRAIAAQTHESIPPLNSTTAFCASDFFIFVFMLSPKSLSPVEHRPSRPPILYFLYFLYFTLPWSPGPTQTCATETPAAPATRLQGSIPPARAPPTPATFPSDHQTRAKTKPASRVPPAD